MLEVLVEHFKDIHRLSFQRCVIVSFVLLQCCSERRQLVGLKVSAATEEGGHSQQMEMQQSVHLAVALDLLLEGCQGAAGHSQ